MRRWHALSSLTVVALFGSTPGAAEPLRGLELHPDAPESVIQAFAKHGINSLVIDFRRQADLDERSFVESVALWGKRAKQHGLRCYLAVRLFGPRDYTGAKGPRPRDPDLSAHDRVEVMLDVDRDFGTYYRLTIDHRGWPSEGCWGDRTWNPTWFVAADASEGTWTAEAAVPP